MEVTIERMSGPLTASERNRLRNPANLWRALIPLVVIVVGLFIVAWPHAKGNGVHVVSLAGPLAAAQQQAGFTVLSPTGLNQQWQATSTDFTAPVGAARASFRVGYVTPTGQYAEFLESNDAPDAVTGLYSPLTSDLPVTVNGASWTGYRTSRGRELISRTIGSVTVVVTGSAPQAELAQLAGALR